MVVAGGRANGRRAVLFVLLAYVLAWLVCLPLWLAGRGLTQPLTSICGLVMMLTPTISALIVHRVLGDGRRLVEVLGLRLGPWRRWLPYALLAWLGPFALSLAAVALAAVIGVFQPDLRHLSGYSEVIGAASGGRPLSVSIGVLVALTLVQVLIGSLINTVPALGEELGWRGFLYDCLAGWPGWRRVIVTGVVWGLWHAPLILLGYNYPSLPPVVGLLFMVVFTTLLAGLFDWLRTGAGNVYVAGMAHGSVNASVGLAVLFSTAGSPPSTVTTGLLGWTGWIVLALALLLALLARHRQRGQRRPTH